MRLTPRQRADAERFYASIGPLKVSEMQDMKQLHRSAAKRYLNTVYGKRSGWIAWEEFLIWLDKTDPSCAMRMRSSIGQPPNRRPPGAGRS